MNTVSSRHSTEKSLAIKIQLRQRAQKWPQNFKRGCLVRLRPPLFRYLDNYLLIFNCDVNFSLGEKKRQQQPRSPISTKGPAFPSSFQSLTEGSSRNLTASALNTAEAFSHFRNYRRQRSWICEPSRLQKVCGGNQWKQKVEDWARKRAVADGGGERDA